MASRETAASLDDVADAVLGASRALVGIAARSMPEGDEVTLSQYRALVLLASHGPITSGTLAELLDVHPSTTTRLVDRLETKGFVERSATDDRREVVVSLAPKAIALLRDVTRRRRAEIRKALQHLPDDLSPDQLAAAFRAFAAATGEVPDDRWSIILNNPTEPVRTSTSRSST